VKTSRLVVTRRATLVAIAVLAVAGYVLLLVRSPSPELPLERTLGDGTGPSALGIYLEPIAIDPLRDAMQMRVSIEPVGARSNGQPTLPDRDYTLELTHDNMTERVDVHAGRPFPTIATELDLYDGDVGSYPFDTYRTQLTVRCLEISASAQPVPVLVRITIWERVLGFSLRTTLQAASATADRQVAFRIRRSHAFLDFALALYGAMVVLGCTAVLIGTLTFLRIRRFDSTLFGALGAMVFALPALRNALPGSPPLGVLADILVFIWAELAAVLSLALAVTTWARNGPRPDP
jgi:hypothetical protein